MARKLVRIVRTGFTPEFVMPEIRLRSLPQAIIPQNRELDHERSDFMREGEFYLVEEAELDIQVQQFAEKNPGREVQVWNLEQVAECPAAAMVRKKVTKEGILPV